MKSDPPPISSIKAELREIIINRGYSREDSGFSNNAIYTSHYTFLTFFPKNLFKQFHRIGNLWFLLVSILMILPFEPAPVSNWSALVPFAFVLSMNMIKDLFSDHQRHKSDHRANNMKAFIWDEAICDFVEVLWKNIEVGNILLIKIDEQVPADCILLKSNNEICYIETSILDGEDNLKVKAPILEISSLLSGNKPMLAMKSLHYLDDALVKTEHSNNRLHSFEGSIKLKSVPKSLQVNLESIVFRGSRIKNTEWAIGLAVFTGADTKLMQNTMKIPLKKSKIEKKVNKIMLVLLCGLFIIIIILSALNYVITKDSKILKEFVQGDGHADYDVYFVVISLMILFNRIVPIALYMDLDIVRILQAWIVEKNLNHKGKSADGQGKEKAQTYDLVEELGQVEFIFSDKTGTLTYNQMELKKCSINDVVYDNLDGLQGDKNKIEVLEFIEHLALCHTVIPETRDGITIYEAASQDEESLVQAAHKLGYQFISNVDDYYIIKADGECLEYKVIGINAYSAERKRMSIVIEPMSDKERKCLLLCKGADSTIIPRLNTVNCHLEKIGNDIDTFAISGLRTLVMAKKELSFEEAEHFSGKYLSAKHALYNKEKILNDIAEDIEKDMEFVGICGIEDKICQGVGETIQNLTQAGIKICVLTGDKPETAMNIAFSTKIFNPSINIINISAASHSEVKEILFTALKTYIFPSIEIRYKADTQDLRENQSSTFERIIRASSLRSQKDKLNIRPISSTKLESLNIGLTIDGDTLPFIINDSELQHYFVMLLAVSQAAVVGRVSPQQKAQFVKLVKNAYVFKPCTLAIGDGANDVPMIQEADIGIGIFGKEGSHAASSSDFIITEFQYLDKLILVQGRWNYYRVCKVALYTFYKNFVFEFPQFLYMFFSCYSGTGLFDSILVGVYNIVFTTVPLIILGVIDKDHSQEVILKRPSIYMGGIYDIELSLKNLLTWFVKSWIHSLCIFFIPYFASQSISPNGQTQDLQIFGTTIYISLIFIVNLDLCLEITVKSFLFYLSVILNIGILIPFLYIYNSPTNPTLSNLYKIPDLISSFYQIILCLTLTIVFCLFLTLNSKLISEKLKQKKLSQINKSLYLESNNNKLMVKRATYYKKYLPQIYDKKAKGVNDSTGETFVYKFYKYSLKFVFPYIEKSYSLSLIENNTLHLRRLLRIGTAVYAMWSGLEFAINGFRYNEVIYRLTMFMLGLSGVIVSNLGVIEKFMAKFLIVFSTALLGGKIVYEGIFFLDGIHTSAVMYPTFCMFLCGFSYELMLPFSFFTIAQVIKTFIIFPTDKYWMMIEYAIILTSLFSMIAFIGYTREKCSRLDFILHKDIEYKYQKGHEILGNLLPGFVKDRVKQGVRYIADYQSSVTVLFCDICDFDSICAMHSPNELLELLDRFFGLLDKLCDKNGLTKIETVNKTYMVCGGLKDSEEHLSTSLLSEHHAIRCIELALEIIEKIENVHLKNGDKLKVKIGITTGPVIAGVVGEHKPQFSLVGDTVNTASRLCATLNKYDSIQISDETFKFIVGKKYKIQENFVFMKGKGNTHTYIITSSGKRTVNRRFAFIEKYSDFTYQEKTLVDASQNDQEPIIDPKDLRRSSLLNLNSSMDSPKMKLNETTMATEDTRDIDFIGPIQWLVCSFSESKITKEFRTDLITMKGRHLQLGMRIFSAIYCIISLLFIGTFILQSEQKYGIILSARVICLVLITHNSIKFKANFTSSLHPWFIMCIMSLTSFVSSVSILIVNEDIFSALILEKMYIFTLTSHMSGLLFGHILGAFFVDLLTFVVIIKFSPYIISLKLSLSFKMLIFYTLELFCSLFLEMQERKRYNINKFAYREIKSTEKLLNQLIPSQVLKNLHHDICTTDRYFDVTIIYADICGFTAWSASKEPIEVISMLSKLFSNFDHLCVRHNVYKVHTIGDCYTILSFTDGDKRDIATECGNVVEIALDMIKVIMKVSKRQKINLNMRIGMHTGEVVAGITGTNIVRYDIYGPDVEIANKMESGGEPGRINVSEVTKDLIEVYQPGRFDFVFNKKVTHKPTNREVGSYFLATKNN